LLSRLIAFSVAQRWLVVLATAAMAGLGILNFNRLPIDAVPDITNVQVQINTAIQSLSPVEVEKTHHVPDRMGDGRDSGRRARALVVALRIVTGDGDLRGRDRHLLRPPAREPATAGGTRQLPAGLAEPVMGPIATGLGEIFMWSVEAEPGARRPDGTPYTLTDLRTIQDWIVRPQLRTIAGVTEVNSIGGSQKAVSRHSGPGQTPGARAHVPGCLRGALQEQRQCRRRLHRTLTTSNTSSAPSGSSAASRTSRTSC
jgi:cobalt-zinc-cadmium resistance protein CzcA